MNGFVGVGGFVGGGRANKKGLCICAAGRKALLLVDHGSRRVEANEMLKDVRDMVVGMKPDVDIIETAHMELAEPTIADGIASCVEQGAEEVVVVPYFLAPGRHSTKDIPEMVEEASNDHPKVKISVAKPLGVHTKIGEVILERAGLR